MLMLMVMLAEKPILLQWDGVGELSSPVLRVDVLSVL